MRPSQRTPNNIDHGTYRYTGRRGPVPFVVISRALVPPSCGSDRELGLAVLSSTVLPFCFYWQHRSLCSPSRAWSNVWALHIASCVTSTIRCRIATSTRRADLSLHFVAMASRCTRIAIQRTRMPCGGRSATRVPYPWPDSPR
jgi:hypothetical protein